MKNKEQITAESKKKVMNKKDQYLIEKYTALISIISDTEGRLRTSELVYFTLNIVVIMFTVSFISYITHVSEYGMLYNDYGLMFLSITGGMSISVCWVIYAMRAQLKLKLRYFQVRAIERSMGNSSVDIFSDENIFFDPEIHRLESVDKKETLFYPTDGITRMDGIAGSIKPRHFSWLFPTMFIFAYVAIFILVITTI